MSDTPNAGGDLLRWFVLGAISLVVLIPLVYFLTRDPDSLQSPPPLPTPRPPVQHPLRPPRAGGGEPSFVWMNPLPRAMPTWLGADSRAAGQRVVFVGRRGAAIRYDNANVEQWVTAIEEDLNAVAFSNADEVVAVGDGGVILRLSFGGDVVRERSPTDADLRAVAVREDGQVFVGGETEKLFLVGAEEEPLELPLSSTYALRAFEGGVYAVGSGGGIVFVQSDNQLRVERAPQSQSSLYAIGGCASAIYAGGENGVLLSRGVRDDVLGWYEIQSGTRARINAITCDHGRAAALTNNGTIHLYAGGRNTRLESGIEGALRAASGSDEGPTWIGGEGGALATIEADHVRNRSTGSPRSIRALGSMGGALVAVGEWGHLMRQREGGFESAESGTDAGLAALIPLAEGRLLALGDHGVLLDIRFDSVREIDSPTSRSLRDGIADGASLLLVGEHGVLVRAQLGERSAPQDWRVSRIEGDVVLWAVDGEPNRALAVGESGTVLSIGESSVRTIPCVDAAGATLQDVLVDGETRIAVGDRSTIVRIEESTCVLEHQDGPTLHAVGRGPQGEIVAVGDNGVLLVRDEQHSWSRSSFDFGRQSARTIFRTSRDVYVAGTGGAIVRHVRLDN